MVRFISKACTEHQALDTDYNRTHILEEFPDQAVSVKQEVWWVRGPKGGRLGTRSQSLHRRLGHSLPPEARSCALLL